MKHEKTMIVGVLSNGSHLFYFLVVVVLGSVVFSACFQKRNTYSSSNTENVSTDSGEITSCSWDGFKKYSLYECKRQCKRKASAECIKKIINDFNEWCENELAVFIEELEKEKSRREKEQKQKMKIIWCRRNSIAPERLYTYLESDKNGFLNDIVLLKQENICDYTEMIEYLPDRPRLQDVLNVAGNRATRLVDENVEYGITINEYSDAKPVYVVTYSGKCKGDNDKEYFSSTSFLVGPADDLVSIRSVREDVKNKKVEEINISELEESDREIVESILGHFAKYNIEGFGGVGKFWVVSTTNDVGKFPGAVEAALSHFNRSSCLGRKIIENLIKRNRYEYKLSVKKLNRVKGMIKWRELIKAQKDKNLIMDLGLEYGVVARIGLPGYNSKRKIALCPVQFWLFTDIFEHNALYYIYLAKNRGKWEVLWSLADGRG